MQTIINIARADWGAALRATARRLAYVVAVLIIAAEITYRAGLTTGHAIHWLSDRLAGLASGRIDRAQTARAVVVWARATLDAPSTPVDAVTPEPSIADMFAAASAAAAASDARLYRSAGESIGRMRAMLDEAEHEPVVVMPCALIPPPAVAIAPPSLDALTVAQLRKLARARGLPSLARKGRRADLLAALTD